MFVQKAILSFDNNVKELFIRDKDSTLFFDTFFNSFNLYLSKRYIEGNKLSITIDYLGDSDISICYKSKKEEKVLFTGKLNKNKYDIDISPFIEGIIYPVFKYSPGFELKSLSYELECESKKITPCILITTYNREEFLIPNLLKLDKCEGLSHIIIVDNAKNVKLPDSLTKEKFTVIPNNNLGGSGGFTRGMMEAKKRGFSHIFIMDDDITLIPEVMEKAFSLVASLSNKHQNDWLGFSMLINDDPLVQYELGTYWNGIKMKLNHHNYDVSDINILFKNQINTKYNYSAWWSLMMPTSVIDKYGYPFPMFIKFDDIEYALRRENEEIILTNGFGVWHENFEKKFNPYLEYYLMRNACVTNAMHLKHASFKTMWRYLRKAVKYYFLLRFSAMKLLNNGYNDYLKGPDFFLSLDIEKNNVKVREIANKKINILKGLLCYPFIAFYYLWKIIFTFSVIRPQYISRGKLLMEEKYWERVFKHE